MPIYAPTLPPAPDLHQGQPPAWVIMRFDFARASGAEVGRFFGFTFLFLLLWKVARIYVDHLLQTNQAFKPMQDFARTVLTQGADFQADLLNPASYLLWFLVALVGGGLVARDTLYRVRPRLRPPGGTQGLPPGQAGVRLGPALRHPAALRPASLAHCPSSWRASTAPSGPRCRFACCPP